MEEDLRLRIIDAAISCFSLKGAKFTMDDVAAELSMSKKTLYKYFSGKEELTRAAIDRGFGLVKESEAQILAEKDTDVAERLRRIIIVLPERYRHMDWRRLYELKTVSPEGFARISHHLETGWEGTIGLLKEGMACGRFRQVSIPVFKSMIQYAFEGFIGNTALMDAGISYEDALGEMIDIIMRGITL